MAADTAGGFKMTPQFKLFGAVALIIVALLWALTGVV